MPGDSPPIGAVADVRLRKRLRADRLVPLGSVLVGATLRFWALGARRLGFDEAFTALADRRPLANLFDLEAPGTLDRGVVLGNRPPTGRVWC